VKKNKKGELAWRRAKRKMKRDITQKIADFFAKNEITSEVFSDEEGDFFATIQTDWQGNYNPENYTVSCSATEWNEKSLKWDGNGGFVGGFTVKGGKTKGWGF
jgi:hypothetical protein